MKIAVIGSGFFGCTISLYLSKKHKIDLFEKEKDILQQASKKNQFRYHLGYHYPRSQKTLEEIKKSNYFFKKFYKKNFLGCTKNYYAISKKKSKTNLKNFIYFCRKNKLKLKKLNQLNKNSYISNFYLSQEKNFNYFKFKNYIKKKLIKNNKITLFLKKKFEKKFVKNYDKIIVCCYNNNNYVLSNLGIKNLKNYKYELVEKVIIKLPKQYQNHSYIILDGKFVCVDPYLGTKYHLLSDVKNSKIEIKNSQFPDFKSEKKKLILNKIVRKKKFTNFHEFIENSSKMLPFLAKAIYIGSFFVIRTLSLSKNSKNRDERISHITKHGKKIISVLSGKWNNCVYVAKKINEMI